MQLTYILISLSYLTFITAIEFEFNNDDLYTSQIWEVNLYLDEEENEIAKPVKTSLADDLFMKESTAYIVYDQFKITRTNFKHEIYYWFGNYASLNLRIKTVELVQKLWSQINKIHFIEFYVTLTRCVSGMEPKNFQNFTKRQYVAETQLYRVKGHSEAYAITVEASHTSLTFDDSFVLTHDKFVYIFIARKSNSVEKLKALKLGNYINNVEHNNINTLVYVDCSSYWGDQNIKSHVSTIFKILDYRGTQKQNELCFSKSNNPQENQDSITSDKNFQSERQMTLATVAVTSIQNDEVILQNSNTSKWYELHLHLFHHAAIIMDPVYRSYVFAYIGKTASVPEMLYVMKELELLNVKYPHTFDWKKIEIYSEINYPRADFVILFRDLENYYRLL